MTLTKYFTPALLLIMAAFVATVLFLPLTTHAQTLQDAGTALNDAGTAAYGGPAKDPRAIAGDIIRGLLGVLGIVSVAFVVYGGYLWMTARGDETQVTKAKDTLRNAFIGLAIIMTAYSITSFVMESILGAL